MQNDYSILFHDYEDFDPNDDHFKNIDPTNCNVDVEVVFNDGRRYSCTIITLKNLESLFRKFENDGECLNGKYFFCPDMIIVKNFNKPDVQLIIQDIVTSGRVESALKLLDPEN